MNDVASKVETVYHSVSGHVGGIDSTNKQSASRIPIATKSIRNDVFTRSQMKEPIVLLPVLHKRVYRGTENEPFPSNSKRANVSDSSVLPLELPRLPEIPLLNPSECWLLSFIPRYC